MANHPSAEKRNRQRIRRTERNRSVKAATRTIVKKARTTVSSGQNPDVRAQAVADAVKAVDRAASKGIIHPRKAARTKSRLARQANKRSKTSPAA
jgi:small subunit ribosomal protein S20